MIIKNQAEIENLQITISKLESFSRKNLEDIKEKDS